MIFSLLSSCSKTPFIMSSSRGSKGKTVWSWCSAEVLRRELADKTCLDNDPGEGKAEYKLSGVPEGIGMNADKQCSLFLMDDHAYAENDNSDDLCEAVK